MPYITFESGSLSKEVKRELIKRLTELSAEITGIPKESFFISIRELPDENIAIGDKTILEIKRDFGVL